MSSLTSHPNTTPQKVSLKKNKQTKDPHNNKFESLQQDDEFDDHHNGHSEDEVEMQDRGIGEHPSPHSTTQATPHSFKAPNQSSNAGQQHIALQNNGPINSRRSQNRSSNPQNHFRQQSDSSNGRHYGTNYILAWNHSTGQPRFALGPHYYIFLIALISMTILFIMLINSMYDHLTWFWLIVMILCGIGFFLAYLNIGLSVPGFASRAQPPENESDRLHPRYCQPCKIIRDNNVYHCYDCDVCIEGYDHHCPWIGKCVGRQNLTAFYFFLFMTFGTLIMCFVATLASKVSTGPKLRKHSTNGASTKSDDLAVKTFF